MKKILSALVLITLFGIFNFCSAYWSHDYYECDSYYYDENYRYVVGGNDYTNFYLDLSSVNVQEYNPPHYQIAGILVSYSDYYHKVGSSQYVIIRYNWYNKETFSLNNYRNWQKNNVNGNDSISFTNRRIAYALFRAAYGRDFYGY